MKRLGTALHVVQKRLIVRGEQIDGSEASIPRMNSWVVDQKRTRVGKVFDIFGPILHPYIIVRPIRGLDAAAHVGKKLYVDEASGRDSKWKRLRS
ncbi:MAG: H/ACA RNA-protein complex component Gar1 [Methanosaeta sp. PtaB.Bin018]|nr:RNA-binding protein [Methanothrix sp.]OPX74200.1 MAG: H/ACA RNA-protein complex component Gar1 [Methanosaeta sp. PtaB.Bin018]OPY43239.1 MAG: H/ACA RNA-protein complex component Gar1 [Methanosaeta sp. PtaU1.Bin016]